MPNTPLSQPRPHDLLEHQLLALWVNAASTGLCVIDDTARVVMLNSAACTMLVVDGTLALNMPLKLLLHAVEGNLDLMQWLSRPGVDGERRVVCKTYGGLRHLLLKTHSVCTETGERFKVVALTDTTQLTEALQSAEQYRRQWQALNAGVVISDARQPDMPIVYVNPAFEDMSGYSSAEVMGRNCRFLQGSDYQQPGLLAIREAVKNQTNGYAVLRNYRKNGELFHNELFISAVRNNQGEVTHFVGIQHLRSPDTTQE